METNASGVLSGVALLHTYDWLGRRTNVSAHNSSTPLLQHSYRYDSASRLTNAADGPFNATYAYLANSPLVSQITHRSNSVTAMTTTKSYDYLNRLLPIANVPAAAGETPITYAYLYNDANQRTRRTDPDDSYWLYEYDPLGQLTSGKHYWQDHTPVAGQQFEYAYDDIGNRTTAKSGGDALGAGLRTETYGANPLNQYTNRTVPGAADIMGIAHASASVTVNALSTYRKDEYFWKELSLSNSTAPVWTNVAIIASLTGTNQTNTGSLLHPKAAELFTFDADGNQTSDSLWTNAWDGENRLIATESGAGVPSGGKAKDAWTLDGQSRWIQRIIYTWNGSAYTASGTNRFLWDRKVLLAILDHTNGLAQSLLRGPDLGGSFQGAGGAGGVLSVNIPTNGYCFLAYDGNGNVVGLIEATVGTLTGSYGYDPFGNTAQVTSFAARSNPIRFGTQLANDINGKIHYLYRAKATRTASWLSRDRIQEAGGMNQYSFVRQSPVSYVDTFGLRMYVDYLSMFVENIRAQFGAGFLAYTDKVKETIPPDVIVPLFPNCVYCARVERAAEISLMVRSVTPLDFPGEYYTPSAWIDIAQHELKRVQIYRAGFDVYLAPIDLDGWLATRCGSICRRTPGQAENELLQYLTTWRAYLELLFYVYWVDEQAELGRIEAPVELNGIMTGVQSYYDIKPPPPFKDSTIPCPAPTD